jgi:CDP-diacylglycerol---glycerol-3-phosphate 3-phosphatidyltransferase
VNVPTLLTLLRILAIPLIVIVYYLPAGWAHPVAAILFALAAITDFFDGYLARSWQQITKLGSFLDPIADKLLVITSLILLLGKNHIPYLTLPAIVIIGREITVSGLREYMAELGKRASVAVTFVGRVKTWVQMTALFLLLWYYPGFASWWMWLGLVSMFAAVVLTLWSMIIYLKLAWPDLTSAEEK